MQNAKKCTKCCKSRLMMHFHKRLASPDGHQNWCIDCLALHRKKRVSWLMPKTEYTAWTICPACNINKRPHDYSFRTDSKNGLAHWCKACSSKYRNEYNAKKRACSKVATGNT